MQERIIKRFSMFIINNGDYSDLQKIKIEYGVAVLWYQLSKLIPIFLIAHLLGLSNEFYPFYLGFIFIKLFVGNFHTTESVDCFKLSLLVMLIIPLINKYIFIHLNENNVDLLVVIGCIFSVLLIFKFAPIYTFKRYNKDKKHRLKLRNLSFIALFLSVGIYFLNDFSVFSFNFIVGTYLSVIMITPLFFRLYKVDYMFGVNLNERRF